MDAATRHLLLRDRRAWLGTRTGLEVERDGALVLAPVPGPPGGKPIEVATAYPYARALSGLALGPCDTLFVADTAHHRILYVDALCAAQAWLAAGGIAGSAPGQFDTPRGLAVTLDALLVADSGNARIQHLALPALEPHLAWPGPGTPTALAIDTKERVLIVDATGTRLRRREPDGTPDLAFDAAIMAAGILIDPLAVAVARDDRVLVSDRGANGVFVFDAAGAILHALVGPPGWLPGALAALGRRVYVADAATGVIELYDDDGARQGILPGYRGPVTALAVSAGGDLYVKPGLDATYFKLVANAAHLEHGELFAGPFDAGERLDWERAWVDAALPEATHCAIEAAQRPAPVPPPLPAHWHALPTTDLLLAQLEPAAGPGQRRYLWLRVRLESADPTLTPRMRQVRAATPGENYLDYLPSTYGRNDVRQDGSEGFLSRLLKLVRGEFSGVEELLDDMPRLADPAFPPASALPWLAQWLALELPQIADDDERRALIARAVALYARRGTPQSIGEFVELHTGIRPTIVEAFEERRLWVLGQSSRLDFDTRLPPLDPHGMVVPDAAAPECGEPGAADCASPCDDNAPNPLRRCETGPIGRAVVGESGPLASHQIGLPLFAEEAYRFCVYVEDYRIATPGILAEIRRIVEREKPAHTDYRIATLAADLRVGLQARVGIDAIVGGEPPGFHLAARLGIETHLAPQDAAARVGDAVLGDPLLLT